MKVAVVLGVLTTLIIMALVIIVYGQQLTQGKIILQKMQLGQKIRARTDQLKEREWIENHVKAQLEWKKKSVVDIESEVKLQNEQEKNHKTASEACQAEKKIKTDVLVPIQKELSDLQAKLNTQKETWNGTINSFKKQMEQRSKICDFLKKDIKDPNVTKFCPPTQEAKKAENPPTEAKAAPAVKQ
ncbi:hypothetical protein DPEC_G00203620 [Dallia pectoralis]|uniref:Uncharacterized protein n=1 Tax=Dallia pectoralis TaxID=75939 RepID=A0ACC2G9W5_DALPE|nr:hypothetical protein DPEC_G00203620 [Dallia pectoralis]